MNILVTLNVLIVTARPRSSAMSSKKIFKIDIFAQQVFKPNSLFIRKLYKKTNPGRPFLLLAADLHQNISKKFKNIQNVSCYITWKVEKLFSCKCICYTCLEGSLLSRARSDSDISTTFWSFLSFFFHLILLWFVHIPCPRTSFQM